MKTKTTMFLLVLLSTVALSLPAQARDEHRGSRWDHHRNYDYRDHDGRHYRSWSHHGSGHRGYVTRGHYHHPGNYAHGYHYHDEHRHHGHHHGRDVLAIIGGVVLLDEILHH